jgi:hypothetical protein
LTPWEGSWAWIRLSKTGYAALGEFFREQTFEAFVQFTDTLGLWMQESPEDASRTGVVTVVLVRWEYIEVAKLKVSILPPPDPPRLLGFRTKVQS